MKKKLLVFALLSAMFASSAIYSQITITKEDLTKYYDRGKVITSYMYTKTVDVNIGKAGGGNLWDFSFLDSKLISTTMTVQEPASTPFLQNFPGSNVAFYVASFEEDNNSEDFYPDVWLYNFLGDDLVTLGNGGRGKIMGLEITSLTYNKPAYVLMKLPAVYGQSWTQKYADSTANKAGGISSYSTGSTTVNTTVDAYGVMKMPGGYSVEALRIKRDMDGYLVSQYGQQSRRRVMEYVFQGKNGDMVNVAAQDLTPPPGGILRTGEIVWTQSKVTDVAQKSPVPQEFSLSPNYPNPFNPETILEYSLPEESFVDIRVYDALGKEISQLLSRTEKAGSYKISFNGSGLPSGIYFFHLKAGNFNAIRKMTLLK
ncbi:MAG TPA: T9SS type A sorting domain-containing protein [Ignavibacteriales bacterium]|nr:T9SS type A sorting domain-containing protein [Ignavibacteriales bacterium]